MLVRWIVIWQMKLINMRIKNSSIKYGLECQVLLIMLWAASSCHSNISDHRGILTYEILKNGKTTYLEYNLSDFDESLMILFNKGNSDTIYIMKESDTVVMNGLVLELVRSDTLYHIIDEFRDTTFIKRNVLGGTFRLDDGTSLSSLIHFTVNSPNYPDSYNSIIVFDKIENVLVSETTLSRSGMVIYSRELKGIVRKN